MNKVTSKTIIHPCLFLELATKFKARDIDVIVAHRRIYSSSSSGSRGVNSLFSLDLCDLCGKR